MVSDQTQSNALNYFTGQSFYADQTVPGHQRTRRLAEHVDVDVETLDGAHLHRLSRVLECGFRAPARRVLRELPDPQRWLDGLGAMPARWWFIREDFEIVVTGFGPFREHTENPSKPFAKALSAALSDRFAASYEGLDVTYHAVDEFVASYDYDSQPLLIHCGLAADRQAISLERYAHNRLDESPDNSGVSAQGRWVVPGGPSALETLWPIEAVPGRLGGQFELDEPVCARVSRDVGEYVCNALYYRSLLAVRQARLAERAAEAFFVHIPKLSASLARRSGRALGQVLCGILESAMDRQFAQST